MTGTPDGPGAKDADAITLDIDAMRFRMEWDLVGETADFLGSFLAAGFEDRDDAFAAISSVANELLENAVKFGAPEDSRIRIHAAEAGDGVRVAISNSATVEATRRLEEVFGQLRTSDAAALFVSRVSRISESRDFDLPGVGLILLVKDYGARLDIDIARTLDPDFRLVTIGAELLF